MSEFHHSSPPDASQMQLLQDRLLTPGAHTMQSSLNMGIQRCMTLGNALFGWAKRFFKYHMHGNKQNPAKSHCKQAECILYPLPFNISNLVKNSKILLTNDTSG